VKREEKEKGQENEKYKEVQEDVERKVKKDNFAS
jgi:hypothetical protein